jgi:hypothetical protein
VHQASLTGSALTWSVSSLIMAGAAQRGHGSFLSTVNMGSPAPLAVGGASRRDAPRVPVAGRRAAAGTAHPVVIAAQCRALLSPLPSSDPLRASSPAEDRG